MSVQTSPCEWPLIFPDCDGDDTPDLPEPLASMSETQQAQFEQAATDLLWNWTGRRYGLCEVTVRPCRQDCWQGISTFTGGGALTYDGRYGRPYGPALIGGQWFNLSCGRCGDNCSCDTTSSLILPGPVDAVSQVIIDGELVDPTAYIVQNHRLLVRVDGGQWPTCQDMAADPFDDENDDNTFAIAYTRGIQVPVGGQLAAGTLTVELAKAACRDGTCQLPQRVQTISRQGVTIGALLDSFDDLDSGHTGIWSVDSWVASVMRTPAPSRVYSPDIPRSNPRRTTWQASR